MKRRNVFSLSHYKLLTGKMGYLYPVACVDVLPGDTFQMATSIFFRFSPLVAPVMTPVVVKVHHFYVPFRLLWDDFEDFITGGPQGTSVPVVPYLRINGDLTGTLSDYLGIPNMPQLREANKTLKINSLYHRAYALIWNEWYRDQNLQEERLVNRASGYDAGTAFPQANALMRAPWEKDYFTTATPWEQKGAAVNVPVNGVPAGQITITGAGAPVFTCDEQTSTLYRQAVANSDNDGRIMNAGVLQGSTREYSGGGEGFTRELSWSDPKLSAAFTGEATLGNIDLNQFREAMALQRFEEHRALYGSRYVEYLRYLGVKASDGRLQRPEYLGGGRSIIQFSEVLQTAEGEDPVGTMRGHGIGAIRTNRFRRFFEEHGVVMTLVSIRPKTLYTQGVPRRFLRELKTDFWQKELEHIGQQEVKNAEIFADQEIYLQTFGFSDRYNEYRHEWSSVHGEFRDLLNYWHLGREFSAAPVLNGDFISSLPSDRVFADQTGQDTIYMMVNNSIQARRLVSKHGTPR